MALTNIRNQWPVIEVSTAPTTEPVCLDDAKQFIQYTDDDQDALIESLIKTAREEFERVTQLALITQTIKVYLDDFPGWEIEIRKPPVASITSVKYTDQDSATQTVATANYQSDLKSYPARLWPAYGKVWPTDVKEDTLNAVIIECQSGFGDDTTVPDRAKTAIKLYVKALFDGCEPGMAYDAIVDSMSWNRTWA